MKLCRASVVAVILFVSLGASAFMFTSLGSSVPDVHFFDPIRLTDADPAGNIRDSGYLVLAVNVGGGSNVTVKTRSGNLSFVAGSVSGKTSSVSALGVSLQVESDAGIAYSRDAGESYSTNDDLSALFSTMAYSGVSADDGKITLSLTGLTIGYEYRLQLFHFSEGVVPGARRMILSDAADTNCSSGVYSYYDLDSNTALEGVEVAVTWTADSAEKSFVLSAAPGVFSRAVLNGAALYVTAPNPYADFLNTSLESSAMPVLTEPGASLSEYREIAEDTRFRVWGITDENSTLSAVQKSSLLSNVTEEVTYLVDKIEDWEEVPNYNRFILGPLLESVYSLKEAGLVSVATINTWQSSLITAVDFQFNEYGQKTAIDWDTLIAGEYPNMDAAYACCMGLAGLIYTNDVYAESAELYLDLISENIQAGGAVRYTGWGDAADTNRAAVLSNASHIYQGVVLEFLSKYLVWTGSERARSVIAMMRDYYPRALVYPGIAENTSTPWWKHTGYTDRRICAGYFDLIAGITGDATNRYMAETMLDQEKVSVRDAIIAEPFYNPYQESAVLADNVILPDPDLEGFRGRFGNFSWVGALGPCQDSLVGALFKTPVMDDGKIVSYDCRSLALVSPEVGILPFQSWSTLQNRAAYVTGESYSGSSMVGGQEVAVLGAQYKLRVPAIFMPQNDETDWDVKQVWLCMGQHLVGRVRMTFVGSSRNDEYVRMRIRTEPANRLSFEGDGEYKAGNIRIKLLQSAFPVVTNGVANRTDGQAGYPNADEIFLNEDPFTYSGIQTNAAGQPYYDIALHVRATSSAAANYQNINNGGLFGFHVELEGQAYQVLYNYYSIGYDCDYSSGDVPNRIYVSGDRADAVSPLVIQSPGTQTVPSHGVICLIYDDNP